MEFQIRSQPYVNSTHMELITPSFNLICVHHAEKRMGTLLRKLMKDQKLGGGTNHDLAGIKIQQEIRLPNYRIIIYGRAICKHVVAMTKAIWQGCTFPQKDSKHQD